MFLEMTALQLQKIVCIHCHTNLDIGKLSHTETNAISDIKQLHQKVFHFAGKEFYPI